jgi:pimeloyl-ACP methyl ester carboxylesterase
MGLVLLLALGAVVATLLVVGWTIRAITRPPRRTYASALAKGRPGEPSQLTPHADGTPRTFEDWTIKHRGVDLPVWDMRGDASDGPTVILSHGWGDSRIGALTRAHFLLPLASRVVMWDMPGHGDAPGSTRMGVDEHEALRTLVERVVASGSHRVVLMGWSLGAGVSVRAASNWSDTAASSIVGVIAEAPYRLAITPARNMLRAFGMPHGWIADWAMGFIGADLGVGWHWKKTEPFDRQKYAAQLRMPLLVLHGERDDISPVADGEAIANAANGTLIRLPEGEHHGLWTTESTAITCYEAVRDFVTRVK